MNIFRFTTAKTARPAIYLGISKMPLYVAFGKTTAWDASWGPGINDTNPPVPEETATSIPEVFVYKKIKSVRPAIPRPEGEVTFDVCNEVGMQDWVVFDMERTSVDLLADVEVNHVVVEVELEQPEFFGNTFRAMGLYVDPQLRSGVSSEQIFYRSSDIVRPGNAVIISYCTPVVPQVNRKAVIKFLLAV